MVSLKDALDGCERILADEFKDMPESALYMIGAISEAKTKAKSRASKNSSTESKEPPKMRRIMTLMTLKVLLPFDIFASETNVSRIVIETITVPSAYCHHV